jgi:hypothetical protein
MSLTESVVAAAARSKKSITQLYRLFWTFEYKFDELPKI